MSPRPFQRVGRKGAEPPRCPGRCTGRERATVQAVSRSVPTDRGGRASSPGFGVFGELLGSPGERFGPVLSANIVANIVAASRRVTHRDGEHHCRQPGARDQDEEHVIVPIRCLRSVRTIRTDDLVASISRPSNEWLHGPKRCGHLVTAKLAPFSKVQPWHGPWPWIRIAVHRPYQRMDAPSAIAVDILPLTAASC